jgi:modulator of FtsH protease HflK
MAWNEPGGGNKDPWSGRGGDQGPPELDEVVRKLQEKLGGLFGGGRRPPSGDGGGGLMPKGSPLGIGVIVAVLVAIWLASGIYIVEPAERGVVMRFGAFTTTTQPGPHWHLPYPIEQVVKVNVDQVSSFRHKAQMLTQDENIVDIELTVQSRIQDPVDFLFQDQTPEKTLEDATETVVRESVGKSKLDFILTQGRSALAAEIQRGTQALIDKLYKTGLLVTSVNMQPAKPPEQVKSAFDDAIKAREDKTRSENKAQAYANGILPVARGDAARVLADASAYRDRVIDEAVGNAARFSAVLTAYQKAPQVTRERMYLDAVQDVLASTSKVIVDVKGGNNLIYLPLDRLLNGGGTPEDRTTPTVQDTQSQDQTATAPLPMRDLSRARSTR